MMDCTITRRLYKCDCTNCQKLITVKTAHGMVDRCYDYLKLSLDHAQMACTQKFSLHLNMLKSDLLILAQDKLSEMDKCDVWMLIYDAETEDKLNEVAEVYKLYA